jgi:hypothetical protein
MAPIRGYFASHAHACEGLKMRILTVCVAGMLLALVGCASISVSNQWKDPNWAGPPAGNVLVVGITKSETLRRLFEDRFVQQLQSAGLTAAASYAQIPSGAASNAQLVDLIKSTGAQAVLATRVERVDRRVDITPTGPAYGGFYGWYGAAWASTPMVTQYDVVTLETSVWDVKSGTLVWTATTQNVASNDIPKTTEQLAQTLIPKLKAAGILR